MASDPIPAHIFARSLSSWDDLRPYGIILLTSEACGLGMRLLFDLTADGRKIVEQFLGADISSAPWNGPPAKASIMLPPEMYVPLAVFCLLTEFDHALVVEWSAAMVGRAGRSIAGYYDGSQWEAMLAHARERLELGTITHYRDYSKSGTAHDGQRNRHHFSGRTV